MNNEKKNDDIDGYSAQPYDLSALTGANLNPALLGPMYGIPTKAQGPEYLDYNITGRSWTERTFYNTGTMYLIGIIAGGSFGFVEGFRTAPSTKFNIRLNSVLNRSGRRGSKLGNALGSVAFLYSLVEGLVGYTNVERYTGAEWVSPVLCATVTGLAYKSTAGPKTMAVAGALGATVAGAALIAKSVLPPRPGSSKSIMFF